jgi:hypothetical protein
LTRNQEQAPTCPACKDKTYAFDRARSLAVYQGALVRAILLLKFEQIEPLGAWFAQRLAELANSEGEKLAADVVVPVPLHRERERERGVQPGRPDLETIGKAPEITAQSGAFNAHTGAAGQTSAEFGGTVGVCAWRFCHTSGRPS